MRAQEPCPACHNDSSALRHGCSPDCKNFRAPQSSDHLDENVLVLIDPGNELRDALLDSNFRFPTQHPLQLTDVADVGALVARPPILPPQRNLLVEPALQHLDELE